MILRGGWKSLEMDLLAKCDHGIKGVLALCTVAVSKLSYGVQMTYTLQLEHALTLAQEG